MSIKTLATQLTIVAAGITTSQQAIASVQNETKSRTDVIGLDCSYNFKTIDPIFGEVCKMDGVDIEQTTQMNNPTQIHYGITDTAQKYQQIESEQRLRNTANKIANHPHYGHVAGNVGINVMDDLKQQAGDFTRNKDGTKIMINGKDIRYVPNSMNPAIYKPNDNMNTQANKLYADK